MGRSATRYHHIVLLALGYFLIGRLGLLLAIPPGYATAIFPPAGLALAALLVWGRGCWPGVWLGSLAMNLSISADPWTPAAQLVAAAIASGSTLQALLGVHLLQRFAAPVLLADERNLLRFTLFGAVLATTVAASIGVLSLHLGGLLPARALPLTWLTWWVGDGIGVLLVTPLCLMLFGQPRALWRPRLLAVAPWLGLAFALVVGMFVASSRWEGERLRTEFRREAEALDDLLRAELQRIESAMYSVERLFAASEQVDRSEFRVFVDRILQQQPALNLIEWVPRIAGPALPAHVERMRALGHPGFTPWQPGPQGARLAVTPAAAHYIVSLVEPLQSHEAALGLDLGFEPVRRQLLEAAQASERLLATPRLRLVQDGSEVVFAALAVRRGGADDDLVVAVVNLAATVDHALAGRVPAGLAIALFDLDAADAASARLYDNGVAAAGDERYRWQGEHRFGERRWALRVAGDADYVAARRSWQGWLVLVGGLVVTALLGALLLLAGGRAERVERLVQERSRALLRSEGIHEAVIGASPDGILLADSEGRIIAANGSAAALFGVSVDALLGTPLGERLPMPALHGVARGSALRQETEARAASGEALAVELTVTPVELDDGRVLSCLLRDLRPRNELARMKNEFIAVVSHELRTPLTSIRGALGLLAGGAGGELPPAAAQLVALSSQNSERLARLIDDLLDFEKLEAGELNMPLQQQPLLPLLQQALAGVEGFAAAARVSLRLHCDDELPEVRVAGDRLVQVLLNLLSNAIKFSPEQSVVTLAARRHGEGLRIEVEDAGIGIPEDQHERVFGVFWQADSSAQRRHSGTGLGLAISKRMTERMGGQIGFHSAAGQGSVFWVALPAA